jgi:hypothetical protein
MPARAKKKFIHNRENSDFEGFGQVGKGVKAASLLSKIFDNQVFQPDFLYSLLVEILSNKMELERVSGVFRACIQCARAHYGRRTGQDRTGQDRTGDQQRSAAQRSEGGSGSGSGRANGRERGRRTGGPTAGREHGREDGRGENGKKTGARACALPPPVDAGGDFGSVGRARGTWVEPSTSCYLIFFIFVKKQL